MSRRRGLVVFRGGGELASASARLLVLAGFPVVVLERAAPLVVRRRVAFAEAVFSGAMQVEGVAGRLTAVTDLEAAAAEAGVVSVAVDPDGRSLARLAPAVLVDGRMEKANRGTSRAQAPLVIALGPGFVAGQDVDAVVETERGPDLGRVIWDGAAAPDTHRPAPVLGHSQARVLRAPVPGRFLGRRPIGALVEAGTEIGAVGGTPVIAGVSGLLRGLLADGVEVAAGVKVGDVDPRGSAVDPSRISDKARAVAAGVLEAVFVDPPSARRAVRR